MRWLGHPRSSLDAYLDGELDALREVKVLGHLMSCGLCRGRVSMTLVVRDSMRSTEALRRL